MSENLLALAERCEAYVKSEMWMTGKDADQALNEAIAAAKGMKRTVEIGHEVLGNVRMVPAYLPNFVNSIDAAVTLVPQGWAWMTGCSMGEGFFADLAPTDESEIEADGVMVEAATAALALCAAALRARAASVDTRPQDGDCLQAPLASGAVPKADAPTSPYPPKRD